MRKLTRRAAAGGLATLGIAATTALATAAPASAENFCIDNGRAIACFESYGDIFSLADTEADGLRPVLEWETDYGRSGTVVWSGTGDWDVRNYNLAEHRFVYFRILMVQDSTGDVVDGTGWREAPIGAP